MWNGKGGLKNFAGNLMLVCWNKEVIDSFHANNSAVIAPKYNFKDIKVLQACVFSDISYICILWQTLVRISCGNGTRSFVIIWLVITVAAIPLTPSFPSRFVLVTREYSYSHVTSKLLQTSSHSMMHNNYTRHIDRQTWTTFSETKHCILYSVHTCTLWNTRRRQVLTSTKILIAVVNLKCLSLPDVVSLVPRALCYESQDSWKSAHICRRSSQLSLSTGVKPKQESVYRNQWHKVILQTWPW